MHKLTFTVDGRLRIRSWNSKLQSLTGVDSSHALGREYAELFPKFLDQDRDAVAEALSQRRAVSLKQCSFGCLVGHRRADIRIVPLRSRNGAAPGARIELVPAEPCVNGHAAADAHRFIAIGKIAATLAHGVRNPLNAIKGAVVYLRDRYAQEQLLVEFTAILTEEISRLEAFISHFLNTTTFDSDIAHVDVNEMIGRIRAFIALQAGTRGIRCEYALEEVPPVEVSAFHMEQALLNVVNNAIEAMTSGGTLSFRTSLKSESPASVIAIEIADTGSGLDPEETKGGKRQGTPGRGFGLFIADEIVRHYNGRLHIRSEKGKGTTVTFLLPLAAGNGRGGQP